MAKKATHISQIRLSNSRIQIYPLNPQRQTLFFMNTGITNETLLFRSLVLRILKSYVTVSLIFL